jgi:hypothetical protein
MMTMLGMSNSFLGAIDEIEDGHFLSLLPLREEIRVADRDTAERRIANQASPAKPEVADYTGKPPALPGVYQ